MSLQSTLFSGCSPSGTLTLGNYIGAVKQWVQCQDDYDGIYCVVDMHAITVKQDPYLLRQRVWDFYALYLACGLTPDKSTIFIQSHNPHHSELTWVLSCLTMFGEMSRMTQFKSKSRKHESTVGLFTYPILMATDILLYQTSLVPVGKDQVQHLEITRDLAERFNNRYGSIFTMPEAYLPTEGAKVMDLQDPGKKMDKSSPNPKSYITLLDTPDEVRAKISKAITDSQGRFDTGEELSGINNLVTIYCSLTGEDRSFVINQFEPQGYKVFKDSLVDVILAHLVPIQERYHHYKEDHSYLEQLAKEGCEKAMGKSKVTLDKVKEAVGF
ncbi:tryptophan--tRNA ligase [Spirochaeta cellobiosiphila]|uniref:tryptophan--tRNA ligase n=1 Tax=Spirochaeta cellobiosiphila TaxID=504483 RepID=UPI00040B13BA|nr:tryptophan--tRNA ligase [Spirochaeta cellobiosiphila]